MKLESILYVRFCWRWLVWFCDALENYILFQLIRRILCHKNKIEIKLAYIVIKLDFINH